MQYNVYLAMFLLWMVALTITGCTERTEADPIPPDVPTVIAAPETRPAEAPPATDTAASTDPIDKDKKPVLYDSGSEKDNSSCMICHLDFQEEPISAEHLKAGLTCMACHGDSEDHRADEYNIIRPDVIWGRAEIDAFCKQCHKKHKHPEKLKAFHKQWDSRRRPNGRFVEADSVCMDCHGKHAVVGAEGEFK